MANLILKPSTGGVLKIQNQDGTVDALSVSTGGNLTAAGTLGVTGATTLSSTLGVTGATTLTGGVAGNTTFADNTTLSGTLGVTGNITLSGSANNLGTIATGNLSNNNIVMPRFKEIDRYSYPTQTISTGIHQNNVNISGSNYVTLTPEHVDDVLVFGWAVNVRTTAGYCGWGIERASTFDGSGLTGTLTTVWSTGQHATGQHGHDSDHGVYENQNGSVSVTATGLSVDTPYYFRMIGMTHNPCTSFWGNDTTTHTLGKGHILTAQRWSIV